MLSVLLLLAGWFYWFQWRPNDIRKSCYQELKDFFTQDENSDKFSYSAGNSKYSNCLVKNGLKSETLYSK